MKNSFSKGFANVAVLIIAIAVLTVGGGIYITLHKQEPAQNNENWKTYRGVNYGFEFKYPSTWFIQQSSDGESLSFIKTRATPLAKSFASFYINNLNVGKYGTPRYATPQEYFDYYFGHDSRSRVEKQPVLQSLQFGQIPVVHHLVLGDNRYVVYTSDRQFSFILYPGDTQNPTEYEPSDNALMEQVIKSLVLTNSSTHFVKVAIPPAAQNTDQALPYTTQKTNEALPLPTKKSAQMNVTIMSPSDIVQYEQAMSKYWQDSGGGDPAVPDPAKNWPFVKKTMSVPYDADVIKASANAAAGLIPTSGGPQKASIHYLKVVDGTAYCLLDIDVDGWAGVSYSLREIHPIVKATLLQFSEVHDVQFGYAPGDNQAL